MTSLWNVLAGLIPTRGYDIKVVSNEKDASQLLRLPPELILPIASKLSAPSASCLALCNRRLNQILGLEFWRSLQSENLDTRLAFLSSLARDLPQHFVCEQCVCLHRIDAIKWPRIITHDSWPRCTWSISGLRRLLFSRYEICFPHIHLAMEQYRGTDIGFPLEAFRHLEVEEDRTGPKTTLLSVDAQIVSNELLMRSQTWILLPWSRRDEYIDELARECLSNDICVHTQLGPLPGNLVSGLVICKLNQLKAPKKGSAETLHCPYCWLDYTLDITNFGERGLAVIITKWINLGAGIDSADAKWQSHLSIHMARGVHQPHRPGDIRTRFEGEAGLSVEELTTNNELKLFSKRQTKSVYQGLDGFV